MVKSLAWLNDEIIILQRGRQWWAGYLNPGSAVYRLTLLEPGVWLYGVWWRELPGPLITPGDREATRIGGQLALLAPAWAQLGLDADYRWVASGETSTWVIPIVGAMKGKRVWESVQWIEKGQIINSHQSLYLQMKKFYGKPHPSSARKMSEILSWYENNRSQGFPVSLLWAGVWCGILILLLSNWTTPTEQQRVVPSVISLEAQDGITRLQESQLSFSIPTPVKQGRIQRQTPGPGSLVEEGSKIELYIEDPSRPETDSAP